MREGKKKRKENEKITEWKNKEEEKKKTAGMNENGRRKNEIKIEGETYEKKKTRKREMTKNEDHAKK